MKYNWQRAHWHNFRYEANEFQPIIQKIAIEIAEMWGLVQGLSAKELEDIQLQLMLSEAIKTSEIEGEYISREDIMSSLKYNLGQLTLPLHITDKRAGSIAGMITQVRNDYALPLTKKMIKNLHSLLMSNTRNIDPGVWRKGNMPMQVVSGAIGKEVVHYEAPPSSIVPAEMKSFVKWYNNDDSRGQDEITNAVIKSAVAHLYFESIHPFEAGNGRVGRALAEKALVQFMNRPLIISLSKTIENNISEYYAALQEAQTRLDITSWIKYFATVILDAQKDAKLTVQFTLKKAKFFDTHKDQLHERQAMAINKMLETGPTPFEGGMTAKKYMSITNCSKATATRDLTALVTMGILSEEGAGRGSKYNMIAF